MRLALLCLLPMPVFAQVPYSVPYAATGAEQVGLFEDAEPGDPHFARVVVQNNEGSGNSTTTFDTAHGPVTVEYLSTVNGPCMTGEAPPETCADYVTITVPDGVVASEDRVEVLEGGVAEILLYHFIGG